MSIWAYDVHEQRMVICGKETHSALRDIQQQHTCSKKKGNGSKTEHMSQI